MQCPVRSHAISVTGSYARHPLDTHADIRIMPRRRPRFLRVLAAACNVSTCLESCQRCLKNASKSEGIQGRQVISRICFASRAKPKNVALFSALDRQRPSCGASLASNAVLGKASSSKPAEIQTRAMRSDRSQSLHLFGELRRDVAPWPTVPSKGCFANRMNQAR